MVGVMDNQQGQAKKRPHTSISPSRWQSTYDKPLPSTLTMLCTPDKCSLCEVPFNGPTISRSHYDGKTHEKKVAQYLTEHVAEECSRPKKVKMTSPPVTEAASGLFCSVCSLICTSSVVYDSHMQGKAHNSKVRAADMAKNGEVGNKMGCSVCKIFVTSADALSTHLTGKQHRRKSERLQEEQEGLVLHCEQCGVTATDKHGLEAHLTGRKHMDKVGGKKDRERFCSKCQVGVDTVEAWTLHLEGEAHKLISAKCEPKVIDYNTFEFVSSEEKEDVKEVEEGQG